MNLTEEGWEDKVSEEEGEGGGGGGKKQAPFPVQITF